MRLLAVALLVNLFACRGTPQADASTERPRTADPEPAVRNVVLVTIDTLRADVLEIYGGPARTPTLRDLAGEGWVFERCISASMLTNPSHASLMTSLYPRDHGVYDNEHGVHDGARTLARALRSRGFQTVAVIGFPHLNPEVSNLGQGFDRIVPATRTERRAPETSARALELVDGLRRDRPFFLWVHYVDPHAPYEPPPAHPPRIDENMPPIPMRRVVRAAPGFQRKNPWFARIFRSVRDGRRLVARYVAEVEAADEGLGLLVEGLRERGLLGETLLVVTSDHGENLGEHDLYFHHGGLYETTVHVPLVVAQPGRKAHRFDDLVETVDIAPTILELTRTPRWEPMRGRSLVAILRGEPWPNAYAFSEHMLGQLVSIRTADMTLIEHRVSSRQFPTYRFVRGKTELYDRRRDPGETDPLPLNDVRQAELSALLRGFEDAGLRYAARKPLGQDRESLRSLGYVE